jgi:hypothetical protein
MVKHNYVPGFFMNAIKEEIRPVLPGLIYNGCYQNRFGIVIAFLFICVIIVIGYHCSFIIRHPEDWCSEIILGLNRFKLIRICLIGR